MLNIEGEHAQARTLTIEDMRRLLKAGVPPRALNRTASGRYAPIRRDRIVLHKRRVRFEFERYMPGAGDAVNAYVLPLVDRLGEDADLLAFRPDGTAALWLGRVAMAGEDEVFAPRLAPGLEVHDSVMGWLCAERRGIAILDHARAAHGLEGVTLRTICADHAKRLRTALARPAPRIMVDTVQADTARAA